jgi:hypothetical protein
VLVGAHVDGHAQFLGDCQQQAARIEGRVREVGADPAGIERAEELCGKAASCVPTSPVIFLMKPSPLAIATNSVFSACWVPPTA